VRRELAAVLEAHDRADPRGSSATTSRAVQHLGRRTSPPAAGPVGELGAADTVREAEVVLDPRALARLPAGGLPLDGATVAAHRTAPYTARRVRPAAPPMMIRS
jgi:hypothetical protein